MTYLTVQRLQSPIASLSDIATQGAKTGIVTATFGASWIKAVSTYLPACWPLCIGSVWQSMCSK